MDDLTSLRSYVIYDSPADAPGKFVVRVWIVTTDGTKPEEAHVFDSLAHARASIPHGYSNIGREIDDDPVIVESWI